MKPCTGKERLSFKDTTNVSRNLADALVTNEQSRQSIGQFHIVDRMHIMRRPEIQPMLENLLRRVEDVRMPSANGEIAFRGFEVLEYRSILHGLDLCSKDIPQTEQRRMLWRAVVNAAKKGKITRNTFLAELRGLEREYLKRPIQRFALVTSLSVASHTYSRMTSLDGVQVRLHPSIPKRLASAHRERVNEAKSDMEADLPKDYCYLVARTAGKSEFQVVDQALDAVNLLRAIWNLYFNRQVPSRRSSEPRKPVNGLLLGPIHTLHLPDGRNATNTWWYDTSFRKPIAAKDMSRDTESLRKFESNVRGYLKSSRYKPDLETALRRYCAALDEYDWHMSFLRLWGLLEFLTATTDKESRITIRRATFLYAADAEYIELRLRALRDYRNRNVHAAFETEEIEAYLFIIKQHVERLIEFHLASEMKFESIEEASEFLDLPRDAARLDRRLKHLKHGRRILSRIGT